MICQVNKQSLDLTSDTPYFLKKLSRGGVCVGGRVRYG